LAKGFKDSSGKFHPTGQHAEFGIPRRTTKRKSVQVGVGRKQEIQMMRIQKRFPNDAPEPDPIGNISTLERMLAEDQVGSEIDHVGFDDNLYEFENNQQWWIFDNLDDARDQAVKEAKINLENNPRVLENFLNEYGDPSFVFITDTDKRIISAQEADGKAIEFHLTETERDNLADVIEQKLEDPVTYFVNELQRYSTDDLLKQGFIRTDTDAIASFIVKTDGIEGTLAIFDGQEIMRFHKGSKSPRVRMYRRN